jgi:hypothetical protein
VGIIKANGNKRHPQIENRPSFPSLTVLLVEKEKCILHEKEKKKWNIEKTK